MAPRKDAEGAVVEIGGGRRVVSQVTSLASLVGAHPDSLRKIYSAGVPADPEELGDAPRGRLLAFAPGADVFLLTRPLVRALAHDLMPWKGKVFDHGGNSGRNVVLGKHVARFHAEAGPSEIDGRPTLALTYAESTYGNPWPIRAIRDELRMVGPGVAIGPALLMVGRPKLLFWFGLEAAAAS
jgi:hypothetical protein